MRRASVIDTFAKDARSHRSGLAPDARVAMALRLGHRDLEIYAAASGLTAPQARAAVERRRQARRRASGAVDALLR